jgi:AhpD family alkylhydroperoxidase
MKPMVNRSLEDFYSKHVAPRGIRHLMRINEEDASALVAQVYSEMSRDFILAPPITIHSIIPELLAGVWVASCESLIAGPANRVDRETIATAVSRINTCPYCVDVHSMMLNGAGQHELAAELSVSLKNNLPVTSNAKQIVEWAMATRTPDAAILASPPFSKVDAPQMIGTAILFHYINRVVNIFLDESPMPFQVPRIMKSFVGSKMTKRVVNVVGKPGESLHLLPESALPTDMFWAASNLAVAGGLARMATAVERAGEAALPAATRELLLTRLQGWRGEDMGLGRGWVDNAIEMLAPEERPAARLAFLAAFSSYQVDDEVIRACRAIGASDKTLLAVVSWASFSAARKIGTWLT